MGSCGGRGLRTIIQFHRKTWYEYKKARVKAGKSGKGGESSISGSFHPLPGSSEEAAMMTEERRKGGVGGGDPPSAAFQKVSLDESSSSLASSTTAIPKRRIIVKSADMKEDMQQEAIDCAVAVLTLSLLCFRRGCLYLSWFLVASTCQTRNPLRHMFLCCSLDRAGFREARGREGHCRVHQEGV